MERNHVVIGLEEYMKLVEQRDKALEVRDELIKGLAVSKNMDGTRLSLQITLPEAMEDHVRYLIAQAGAEYAISEYNLRRIDIWGIAERRLGTTPEDATEHQDGIDRAIKEINELNDEGDVDIHNATDDGLPF